MMKESIGILTYSNTINYGGCLQAYALQSYLSNLGYDVELINYQPKYCIRYKGKELLLRFRSWVWQNTVRQLLKDRKRIKRTETFRQVNTKRSKITYSDYNMLKKCECYQYLIVGSDQVWNPQMIGLDPGWFLKFGSAGKRISYAASFGISTLLPQHQRTYAAYLKDLNKISVREETGAQIVNGLIGYMPPVVVDPVFLVDRAQWERLIEKPKESGYVLCYYMPGFPEAEREIRRIAQTYAQKHGLKILSIGKRETARLNLGENNIWGVGPAEFLGLIQNAEAVVTNSFHGTAFSILFEKRFVSVVNRSDLKGDLSSRIVDLLSRLDMQMWVVEAGKNVSRELDKIPENSKELLRSEIEKSKCYLCEALEG